MQLILSGAAHAGHCGLRTAMLCTVFLVAFHCTASDLRAILHVSPPVLPATWMRQGTGMASATFLRWLLCLLQLDMAAVPVVADNGCCHSL